jgi:hypothetical protein
MVVVASLAAKGEKSRHDVTPLGGPAEGRGKSCMGVIKHGLEPWRHVERPDRRRRLSLSQVEVRCLSCHACLLTALGHVLLAGHLQRGDKRSRVVFGNFIRCASFPPTETPLGRSDLSLNETTQAQLRVDNGQF